MSEKTKSTDVIEELNGLRENAQRHVERIESLLTLCMASGSLDSKESMEGYNWHGIFEILDSETRSVRLKLLDMEDVSLRVYAEKHKRQ
jgi:hypothetical protein